MPLPQTIPPDYLLTIKEASKLSGCSMDTLRAAMTGRKLRATRVFVLQSRITAGDLAAWMDGGTNPNNARDEG